MVPLLQNALEVATSLPFGTDWNIRETAAFEFLKASSEIAVDQSDVFMGGDRLRPYLTVCARDQFWFLGSEGHLVKPGLLAEFKRGGLGGGFEEHSLFSSSPRRLISASANDALKKRLAVPNLYLATLTNAKRYRARRYPLNVARLAQWARFQHLARVCVTDLALTFEGEITNLAADIRLNAPEVIGVSVNFGELSSLELLIDLLHDWDGIKPLLCIGNVLAAWSVAEVQRICQPFEVILAPSYGESIIEHACRLSITRMHGDMVSIDTSSVGPLYPSTIVYPDEALLAQTIARAGQAGIETSFGCQYGRCTFCPRDHRSKGWRRPARDDAVAVVGLMAADLAVVKNSHHTVLSIVDEDAFGSEGIDPKRLEPSILPIVHAAGIRGVACEIYTRAEQLFNARWAKPDSLRRLHQLSFMQPWLSRVFVGVESGSDTQLFRYGKGQTLDDIVYALRAGSLIGLPLEFGFITFDPLTTEKELVDNIKFLARRDILLAPVGHANSEDIYHQVLSGPRILTGDPVYSRVAYMATEIELFAGSQIAARLQAEHPWLIKRYDSTFARFHYEYADIRIGRVAGCCRVWTEGTFAPMYRLRLASRAERKTDGLQTIQRYREATFALLMKLTAGLSDLAAEQLAFSHTSVSSNVLSSISSESISTDHLSELWSWVIADSDFARNDEARFSLENLETRRDS